jgi:hypothetical protein
MRRELSQGVADVMRGVLPHKHRKTRDIIEIRCVTLEEG